MWREINGRAKLLLLLALVTAGHGQTKESKDQVNVNWLYGAYLPKDVPLTSLTGKQRFQLYLRQTYTTPGIYAKTVFFTIRDQSADSPPDWNRDAAGFVKRFASRQGQFIIQNSLQALGNAAVGWEPRYERCRCSGFWLRTRHAAVRNFVTYARDEESLRPQLMPYAAAYGAGAIAARWQPNNPSPTIRGYQAAITQVFVGVGSNWLGEFMPDILNKLRRKKQKTAGTAQPAGSPDRP
jgi:hypothetical protein